MTYYWAQVNAYKLAMGCYFVVKDNETLEDVVDRHFENGVIVAREVVTKEYAEKHMRRGIFR